MSSSSRDHAHSITGGAGTPAPPITDADLLETLRFTLLDIADRLEDDGDRTFLGSTNDGDTIRRLGRELDDRRWREILRKERADGSDLATKNRASPGPGMTNNGESQ